LSYFADFRALCSFKWSDTMPLPNGKHLYFSLYFLIVMMMKLVD
jgi:hypothetical protein